MIEKEGLAVVWGCKYFHQYLYGREFVLESDHRPLQILKSSNCANGRITRWALALQDYDFVVRIIPGVDNHGADILSRVDDERTSPRNDLHGVLKTVEKSKGKSRIPILKKQ